MARGRIERLSAAAARRIALAAQGLADPRPTAPTARDIKKVFARLGLLQIDSVNVLVRSHYLPLFSRLGPYPRRLLDEAAYAGRRRWLFEYWAHEASLVRLDLRPLFRWRMERAARGEGTYGALARFGRERRTYVESVYREVAENGPLIASELSGKERGRGSWWGWSDGKRALEFLFWAGRITTARRRESFERVYDVPERVFPASIVEAPTVPEAEAQRELLRLAARAFGVATERDLRDYFRLDVADTRQRLAELVEEGALIPVEVEGWAQQAYLDPAARHPRKVTARALLSPFDALVWERARAERLFGFHYRIEIYTPAAKRTHGYYVLPFLLDDRLVARVDLKADRAASRLLVHNAHREDHMRPADIAEALASELQAMAAWLGLERIEVGGRGELSRPLRDILSARAA
jgi:uncharacterized protein